MRRGEEVGQLRKAEEKDGRVVFQVCRLHDAKVARLKPDPLAVTDGPNVRGMKGGTERTGGSEGSASRDSLGATSRHVIRYNR